ncbi:hypothetical protein CPB84DRAFT_1961626 [Gymnopilus junonius]|uniref:RING-type domain-containing protein n=1 Tax=Gymnopilus junonius TaxID=109634 RepID=A0A9P5NQ05_GYMJU|nr:hypothetical protein CPB84DRAFT_1961626 [Gymnopilus junonius]
MVAQCPICLSSKFKEPVCTPCGHVYCKECLVEHVNVPTNRGLTSNCPECRSEFHLSTPDLAYLPEKYHPFVQPAVRRIYAEMSPDAALQKKLKQVEKTLMMRNKTEELLMKKCEGLSAAIDAHRKGERDAVAEAEELEERLDELQFERDDTVARLNGRCYELEQANSSLLKEKKTWNLRLDALQKRLDESEATQRLWERALKQRAVPDSPSTPVSAEQFYIPSTRGDRLLKPLPRRRLLRTRDEDPSSVSLASVKRARISDV